jgi:HEAT repeat protein
VTAHSTLLRLVVGVLTALALGSCGEPGAPTLEEWRRSAKDDPPTTVDRLARAGRVDPALLERLLSDEDIVVVNVAALAASESGVRTDSIAGALGTAIRRHGREVDAAAAALGRMGELALGPASDLLRQSEPTVRQTGINVLAVVAEAHSAGVPPIVGALRDPASDVRLHAIDRLGKLGTRARAAIPQLEAIVSRHTLTGESEDAREALRLIDGRPSDDDSRATDRAAASQRPETVPQLVQMLASTETGIAIDGLLGLERLLRSEGSPHSAEIAGHLDAITNLLRHRQGAIRRLAASVLGLLGERAGSAVEALRAAASDPELGVRLEAEAALKRIR